MIGVTGTPLTSTPSTLCQNVQDATARGCRVTVLDESARPGGQIYRQADPRLPGTEIAEPTELARKKRLNIALEDGWVLTSLHLFSIKR